MKKCSFCAEEIQDEAIKCKYCGEFLYKKPPVKWFFKTAFVITTFLCVGPLALPLVWFHPTYSRKLKIIVTIVVVVLTYYLAVVMANSIKSLNTYYKQILL